MNEESSGRPVKRRKFSHSYQNSLGQEQGYDGLSFLQDHPSLYRPYDFSFDGQPIYEGQSSNGTFTQSDLNSSFSSNSDSSFPSNFNPFLSNLNSWSTLDSSFSSNQNSFFSSNPTSSFSSVETAHFEEDPGTLHSVEVAQGDPSTTALSASDAFSSEVPNPQSRSHSPARVGGESSSSLSSNRKGKATASASQPDCKGTIGKRPGSIFQRPPDGRINSYIKFNWNRGLWDMSEQEQPGFRVADVTDVTETEDASDSPAEPSAVYTAPESNRTLRTTWDPVTGGGVIANPRRSNASATPQSSIEGNSSGQISPSTPTSAVSSSPSAANLAFQYLDKMLYQQPIGHPKPMPPNFGFGSKMDQLDRMLWDFYIKAWCPGRSILEKSNSWLQDIAQMESNLGVKAAIQSLVGSYVYDYCPAAQIIRRTNDCFLVAEGRLEELINRPSLNLEESDEVITISALLSMQDIVLTERRRKGAGNARWLKGFRTSANYLQQTDKGQRFWDKKEVVQLSSLRIGQSIIVGRAVILAQPMMPLRHPSKLIFAKEHHRYGWLLYGIEREVYDIHGGCGFSRRLLHAISQITLCAARIAQTKNNKVMPVTAKYLYEELCDMRQWNSEVEDWEMVQDTEQPITQMQQLASNYVIKSRSAMTKATAEAWRIAAIIYLLCRTMRLPRNHPTVLKYMEQLALCISLMPTSGSMFTAQSPLFPVFLLGLIATVPEHKRVSRKWFDEVTKIPVRSSVPPLYSSLQRIWKWIDSYVPLPAHDPAKLSVDIGERDPWWETLIGHVQVEEDETLCLT